MLFVKQQQKYKYFIVDINFMVVKMMIPKILTKPSGLVRRMRNALRYWQGYGEGNGSGPVWKCYRLPELENTTLTEPVMSHVSRYTLDEYVALGGNKRYAEAFRYVVVPGKPRLDLKQIKEPCASEKIEDICNSIADKFVEAIGISPSERWKTELAGNQLKPPRIIYNYNKFDRDYCRFSTFTEFDIFVAPSEQLVRDYGKLHDPNPTPFGGMPPRFIITLD